jgi:hypothetical protein
MDDAAERVRLVSDDMDDVELADRRLTFRARRVVRKVAAAPDAGFPEAMGTEADLEGFYRFLANEKVTKEALLRPHIDATLRRLAEHRTVVLAHDITEFSFGGQGREGLGKVRRSGNGFKAHFCLAMVPDETRDPLGVVDVEMWARSGISLTERRKKKLSSYAHMKRSGEPTDQDIWGEMVSRCETSVAGTTSLVHLMDSEADDYGLLASLVTNQRRFVIRLSSDRRLDAAACGANEGEKAQEFVRRAETIATRDVQLSRRRHSMTSARNQKRAERLTTIAFSSRSIVIKRPDVTLPGLPKTLRLNVVAARELDAPSGQSPVEWLLFTTEPVETPEQVLAVVDLYRCRWLIEEYFKALKTGCAVELRQLETSTTIFKALAIFTSVAWAMLRMRTLSRLPSKTPITMALSSPQIEILRAETRIPLRKTSSVLDGYLAIARLGGHLKSNGPPGWQVIGRGYSKLLNLEAGYKIAKRATSDRW